MVSNGGKTQKIEKSGFIMYLCWAKCLYEVEIGGEKSEFAFPRTILKFLRCFCAQDVAGKIRDTAFKISMENCWTALKLSAL